LKSGTKRVSPVVIISLKRQAYGLLLSRTIFKKYEVLPRGLVSLKILALL